MSCIFDAPPFMKFALGAFRVYHASFRGETVEKYARKGMLVFVQGKLQMRKYTDKTKTEQTSVEVIADNIQLLEEREKE
jgi:single-stranded DNA-binding protein